MDILDIIVTAMGIYVLWAAIQLRNNGTISSQVMKSPNQDVKKIRDLPGFQKFIYPKCMLMGILVTALGLFSLAKDSVSWFEEHGAFAGYVEAAFVIAVIIYMGWYVHEIHVAEKKFY